MDTFFTISGLLVLYSHSSEENKISCLALYIRRFFRWSSQNLSKFLTIALTSRLSPSLFATILLNISVVKHLASGPLWSEFALEFSGNCLENWWATLLFVNNFLVDEDQVRKWFVQSGLSNCSVLVHPGSWRSTSNSTFCHHSFSSFPRSTPTRFSHWSQQPVPSPLSTLSLSLWWRD